MIILGENSDDKGKQLELFTKRILNEIGYKNIVLNLVSNGGQEIDLFAEYEVPLPDGNKKIHEIICECKAYVSPVGMSEWLKFLGKIFQQSYKNKDVIGCFIALSGVNGNVYGSFRELKDGKKVLLITENILLENLNKIYKLCSLEELNNKIHSYTNKQIILIEVMYYSDKTYWLIIFEDNNYSVLNYTGDILDQGNVDIIISLLKNSNLSINEYIDLEKELLALNNVIKIKKGIIAKLMLENGSSDINNIFNYISNHIPSISLDFVKKQLEELLSEKLLIKLNELEFSFPQKKQKNFSIFIKILAFYLEGESPAEVIGCEYYDSLINKELIKEISRVQLNLKFSKADYEKIIEILKYSPTALLKSIQPIPFLITHRKNNKLQKVLEDFDKKYFFNLIFNSLKEDFGKAALFRYFYENRGLRELEINQIFKIKNKNDVIFDNVMTERLSIGEQSSGGYVLVALLEKSPQPWEIAAKFKKIENT